MTDNKFHIGVEATLPDEDWWCTIYGRFLGAAFTPEIFQRAMHELGADFSLFYDSLAPRLPRGCERISEFCEGIGLDYLFNNTYGDIYGPWVPSTSRAEYTDAQLTRAAQSSHFLGIILDEVEHRQIHHYDCGDEGPYLADVQGKTLPECYEAVLASLQAIAGRYREYGVQTVAEMVFPVMAHVLAHAGGIPAPKFLSENFAPVAFAICAGAALQYNVPLWIVHDFWSVEPFWAQIGADSMAPGCSPETYRGHLLLSYWLGADGTYTEALHNLISLRRLSTEEHQVMTTHPIGHRGSLDLEWLQKKPFALNAYGKIHRWFTTHYLPNHPRRYTFRDTRPRVAIIRFPDTLWQNHELASWGSKNGLYGPGGPAIQSQHLAWLDLWHILTHGVVPRSGLSLFCPPCNDWCDDIQRTREHPDDYAYREYLPFCPLDGVLVFDHRVGAEHLQTAELIVLTGELVEPDTLQAALRCIERGVDGLALPHLLPEHITRGWRRDPIEIQYGQGRLLISDDFSHDAVKRFIQPHIGPSDRIRYTMGDTKLDIRPAEGYGGGFVLSTEGTV